MDKYIEISKARELKIMLTQDNLEYGQELKKSYKLFEPFGELVPLVELRYSKQGYYYHGFIIALRIEGVLIQPIKVPKEEKYIFYLPNPYRHRHLEYYKCRLERPDKIGVPTKKKLKEWITYLLADEQAKRDTVSPILKQELDYRDELKKLGSIVKWENEYKALIEKNNLRFTVWFNPGGISTDLSIIKDYKITLSYFLTMINYKPDNLENQESKG